MSLPKCQNSPETIHSKPHTASRPHLITSTSHTLPLTVKSRGINHYLHYHYLPQLNVKIIYDKSFWPHCVLHSYVHMHCVKLCIERKISKSQQVFWWERYAYQFSLVQFSCIEIMKWEKNLMNLSREILCDLISISLLIYRFSGCFFGYVYQRTH